MRQTLFIGILMLVGLTLGAVEIRLHKTARIEGRSVLLGQIAKITAGDATDWESIVVMTLPEDVLERIIGYGEVSRAIRTAKASPFVLVGGSVTIRRSSTVIKREAMLSFVRDQISRQRLGIVIDLELSGFPIMREFAGSGLSLRLESDASELVSGPWQGRLAFLRDETVVDEIRIAGRIRIPGMVLIAARDCYGGTVLRPEDVRLEAVDDLGRMEGSVTADSVKGRRLLADIKEGMRITPDLLEKPLVVKRGARVEVVWRRNGVIIEALAEALEDGREGDVIRLRNPHTAREFRARITEKDGKVFADG